MVRTAVTCVVKMKIIFELVEDSLDEEAAAEDGSVCGIKVGDVHVGALVGHEVDALLDKGIGQRA